jgi:predicted cupin superfamily sugar epimerase
MDELQALIEELGLQPHPEGGFYKETFRSPELLSDRDRNLITAIYFILTSDNVSKFHRIVSDELWFFHAGSPLIVHTLNATGHQQTLIGTDLSKGEKLHFVVPKNTIFGSSVSDSTGYSFVSCVVAPGFDFADFELFEREYLLKEFPNHSEIIHQLT